MSLVDDTFGPIPGPLIAKWGQPAVFVQQTGSTYDPVTGSGNANANAHRRPDCHNPH